jgi:hypothetical protein
VAVLVSTRRVLALEAADFTSKSGPTSTSGVRAITRLFVPRAPPHPFARPKSPWNVGGVVEVGQVEVELAER